MSNCQRNQGEQKALAASRLPWLLRAQGTPYAGQQVLFCLLADIVIMYN